MVHTPDGGDNDKKPAPTRDPEPFIVKCRECGVKMCWSPLYGDWCSICKPRGKL